MTSPTPIHLLPPTRAHFRCVCGLVTSFDNDRRAPSHAEQARLQGGTLLTVGERAVWFCSEGCRTGAKRPTPTPMAQSRCAHCGCVTAYPLGSPPEGSVEIDAFTWFCSEAHYVAATTPPPPPTATTLDEIAALEQADPVRYREFVRRTLAQALGIGGAR